MLVKHLCDETFVELSLYHGVGGLEGDQGDVVDAKLPGHDLGHLQRTGKEIRIESFGSIGIFPGIKVLLTFVFSPCPISMPPQETATEPSLW